MVRRLEFAGEDLADAVSRDGEGAQGRRDVEVLERTGHGVLAADGGDAEVHLRLVRAEERGGRLAPALRVGARMQEVLLEGQVDVFEGGAGGDEFRDRLDHGQVRAVELVLLEDVRVVTPRHEGDGLRVAVLDGDLVDHGLDGCGLGGAAERHEDRAGTDGGVEALGEAASGADVEVLDEGFIVVREAAFDFAREGLLLRSFDGDVLLRAVRVQELAGDVDDGVALPVHGQVRVLRHGGDHGGLEVFLGGQFLEPGDVLRLDDDGHTLLRFGDGEFGTVKAFVLLRDFVKVDLKAISEFADGDRDTAGTEVVAALDELRRFGVAEQSLEFALFGSVTLLDLGTAGVERLESVRLGGAGGAADAVTAGTSAEQDDYIARVGTLASDVLCGSGSDDRADLHSLGGIAVMVEFVDDAGGKADLVAVGAVAVGSRGDELALGQLALHGLGEALQRVCRARDTHGRVDIGTAGQRVADGAADAGGGSTEGFDLRRMVVGLILEEEQPVLVLAVVVDGHLDGTGVDLLGLVELLELALFAQDLRGQRADVHEVHGLRAADALAVGEVFVISLLQELVLEGDFVDGGEERRMTAVVGPVGVDHTDLGDGRVAVLGLEVLLAERDVVEVHGQAQVFDHVRQLFPALRDEPVQSLNGLRKLHLHGESLRQVHGSLTGFDRVDDVLLDLRQFLVGDVAAEQVDLG